MSAEHRERLDYIRDCTAQDYLQRFQVTFLPRSQWISRNAVSPACCRVSVGRPLGPKKQAAGSFNERRELQSLSWKQRVERGCHADWIQQHRCETEETACVLQGPLSGCHVDSWYVIVGAALPAVRNSPFCAGVLLDYVTQAQLASDLNQVPSCDSCHIFSAASILSDVAGLCTDSNGTKKTRQCMVFGSRSDWDACGSKIEELLLTFPSDGSYPRGGREMLHDAAPPYQHELVGWLVLSLRSLTSGDALLLPVPSALTRVSAALVLCLHVCFRSIKFRCPPPEGGVGALLVCAGFCPDAAARILPALTEVQNCIGELLKGEDAGKCQLECDRQVLQFVPMEELLNGGLTEFLRTMNSEIMRHRLHLLMQA
ncbi:cap-specific mRNA (nucleoside-2'-O-)-methyltransferase 2 isoform X5 [Phycodurus eques]|nr:cap-specific mRNA (nucleoside-2'-O-)-methyltransferase 2 isoform X5 [Phycodurus eques]